MELRKYCHPDHHITQCSTLLIGNLAKYRETEETDLQDKGEGIYRYKLSFPMPVKLESRLANLIFPGFAFGDNSEVPHFDGSFQVNAQHLDIERSDHDYVYLNRAEVTVTRQVPNAHIFCMSLVSGDFNNPFPDMYSSYWSMPLSSANDFSERVVAEMLSQLSNDAFERNSLGRMTQADLEQSMWRCVRHMPVRYKPRDYIVTPDDPLDYDELVRDLHEISFIKPEKFRNEQEYRFEFRFGFGNNQLPATIKDQFLNFDSGSLLTLG